MDAWGAVREAADACRARTTGSDGDATTPLERALDEADLVVRAFTPGSPGFPSTLKGRLERIAGVIHVSDAMGPIERDFVVAHELGHFHLHVDPILEDRCAPAGNGLGRTTVDGYSTRELKELQADLFAAQFLCPAGTVRDALADGRTARSLAEELGVAPSLVHRQAVDALLVAPPTARVPSPGQHPIRPDAGQTACAAWSGGALLVEGGPGTGKTNALLTRARELLSRASAARILIVVASDAAVATARAGLDASHRGASVGARVCTFGDLALEVVLKWHGRIGLRHDLRVFDLPSRIEVEAGARPGAAGVDCDGDGPDDGLAAGAVVTAAIRILDADPAVLAVLRERFASVLVDDLQDATAVEADFLARLCPPGHDLVATGDAGQRTRSFAGADGRALADFAHRHRASRLALTTAHRSRGDAGALLARLDGHPGGVSPSAAATVAETDAGEVAAIRDAIEALRSAGVPYREQVVLARTHRALGRVADGLAALGVPLLHLGDLHRRADVRDLVALLSFVRDGSPVAFRRLAGCRAYGASSRDVDALLALARRERRDLRTVPGRVPATQPLTIGGRAALARMGRDLAGLDPDMSASTLVGTWLFDRADYLRPLLGPKAGATERMSLAAIHHFLVVCGEQEAQGGRGTVDLIERLMRVGSRGTAAHVGRLDLSSSGLDAVSVMTMHAARGREFTAVHLGAAANGILPPGRTDMAEERRLFRLAISRARGHVRFSWAERRVDGSSPRRRASPFLDGLVDASAMAGPPRARANPIVRTVRRFGRTHLESDLAVYLACPAMYAARLGRDLGGIPRMGPRGLPGATWLVPWGMDTVRINVEIEAGSEDGSVLVRHVAEPGIPDGVRRAGALTALLREGARRSLPGRMVRVDPSPDAPAAEIPVGGGPYGIATAGIARGDFEPTARGTRTCASCPHFLSCEG